MLTRTVCRLMIVLIALVGCGRGGTREAAATITAAAIPPAWQPLTLESLSLALPPGWSAITSAEVDLAPAVEAMSQHNPHLAALLRAGEEALRQGQIEVIAYDLEAAAAMGQPLPASLRIGTQPYSAAPDPQRLAEANVQQLRATPGFSNIEHTTVLIGDVPAARLRSTLTISDTEYQPLTLLNEQYLLVGGTQAHLLSFTLAPNSQPHYRPIIDQILSTLRLTP
ncbi:hypothetical protein [Kallotenue papyrolyticum]|uniref:hypothetical protein n=1 Tax=Kallotenue papyrolyticum TaxID=1325125 RepID=UPI000492D42A|nr:hypothetical protein [Kallotenue papyrolyticum]